MVLVAQQDSSKVKMIKNFDWKLQKFKSEWNSERNK